MAGKKVLVTGMSGLIGGLVRERIESKYTLSALNRSPVEGVECHQGDIADLDAIRPAFEGLMSSCIWQRWHNRSGMTWEELLRANIIGCYNVFEASRGAGVKRIVFASSGATVRNWDRVFPYDAIVEGRYDEVPETWKKVDHETPTWPGGLYGCSKVFGEALARHFTDTCDISIISLRIGAVTRENRPTDTRGFSVWCSQRDVAQMIEKCIEAPDSVKFEIFEVVSDNKWAYRDISHARAVVGYAPEDAAEDYR